MAMGPGPIGGTSGTNTPPRPSNRPIYEDFQPHIELKEEQEAHRVLVHLPGFVKEQVRITLEHNPDAIRVHGRRPIGNNKWSRFNQTFPIQENCDASKTDGKFNDGILTITIPKQVITQTAAEDQIEANGKRDAEPKNAEKLVKTTQLKERETGERSKEANEVSMAENVMAGAKLRTKNLGNSMSNEEKQMLSNMGVAVLVLLALGAAASYNFWFSGTGKN